MLRSLTLERQNTGTRLYRILKSIGCKVNRSIIHGTYDEYKFSIYIKFSNIIELSGSDKLSKYFYGTVPIQTDPNIGNENCLRKSKRHKRL